MIPASYFFQNAYYRQWEQPELPEGAPVEAEQARRTKLGLFRRLVTAITAAQGPTASMPACRGKQGQVSAQRV